MIVWRKFKGSRPLHACSLMGNEWPLCGHEPRTSPTTGQLLLEEIRTPLPPRCARCTKEVGKLSTPEDELVEGQPQ